MIINRSGITIRMNLSEMRVLGRATQGVRLIELRDKDQIAAVAKVDSDLHEEDELAPSDGTTDPEAGSDEGESDGTDIANAPADE